MWIRLAVLGALTSVALLFSQLATPDDGPLAEWEVHDSLGHDWSNELLHYSITLRHPIGLQQPLTLVDEQGSEVPIQIVTREPNEAGQVAKIGLAFITDLRPFEQHRFRLLAMEPKTSQADLSVKKEGDRWLLQTSKIGVAIPAGSGEGKQFADLPAPIAALRGGGTEWVGKGWLTGPSQVVSWKTEILTSGPVLAKARITYDFGQGRSYAVEIIVPTGQPVVLVREQRNLPEVSEYNADPKGGDVFLLALAPGLKPTHVYSKRGISSRGSFVEPGPEFKGTYLTPAQMNWVPSCCNIVGTWHESNESASFIGLFPRFLSHWTRPHHTFVPLAWDRDQGLVARFPLNHGSREWALMAGTKREMIEPKGAAGEQIGGYFGALLLNNKWGETPLDKVKDWVLDWGDLPFERVRKPVAPDRSRGTMPYFAEQFLLGGQKWHDTYIHVHQTWTGEGDAWAKYQKTVRTLSPERLLAQRAAAAFVMYKQTDPDYWPSNNWIGPANPNMIFMGNAAIVLGAQALRDHPMARAWTEIGFRAVRENLVRSTSPDGAWIECPGYDGAGIQPILRAALELHRTGLSDLLGDGRLLKVALYHANLVTPPDPRVHGVRHLPEFGDCFNLQTDKYAERARPTYWKEFAAVLAKTHPKELGQILWALGEKKGPVPIVPIDGKSRQVAGFGAVFRDAFNTPDESYLAIHQDSFGFGHYHYDLGSLYLFAKGAPLCVDWPSLYEPQIPEAWMHNCVSVARMKRFAYQGRVRASALLPECDYSRSRVYYDAAFPPNDTAVDDGLAANLPMHCWQRQVVWMKSMDPGRTAYVIVRDEVRDERPTDWNLWTLAGDLKLQKRQADVTGQYGVDLAVRFFLGPDEAPTTEMFGFGKPSQTTLNNTTRQHLYQQSVVRMASASGGTYGAMLYPHRPSEPVPSVKPVQQDVVQVSSELGEDFVFVYPLDRSVSVSGISFAGRSGVVRKSPKTTELLLLEGQSLRIAMDLGVRGEGPVSVLSSAFGRVEVHSDGRERELEVIVPEGILGKLASTRGVTLVEATSKLIRIRVASGPCACVLY